MEVYMELSKKTTILLSPRLYKMLKGISEVERVSIGELIRSACEKQYGLPAESEAIEAVQRLSAMALPVGTPDEMKREALPKAEELMP